MVNVSIPWSDVVIVQYTGFKQDKHKYRYVSQWTQQKSTYIT